MQDVVYYFAPTTTANVTISLCASNGITGSLDAKLYVVADLLAPPGQPLRALACADDFCAYQPQITVGACGRHSSSSAI